MGLTASAGLAQGFGSFSDVQTYRWSGFYAGLQGGYGFADGDALSGPFPGSPNQSYGYSPTGWLGGAHFGYNFQYGHYLLGAEVDLEGTTLSASESGSLGTPRETHLDWQSSLRGRLGWTSGPWLLYGTAGIAWARGRTALPAASFKDKYTGWTVGLGVERAIASNATLRLEYRYTDFGSTSYANSATALQDSGSLSSNALRAGITLRF